MIIPKFNAIQKSFPQGKISGPIQKGQEERPRLVTKEITIPDTVLGGS